MNGSSGHSVKKPMERKPHRACMACKTRKVKCNGKHPVCQQCAHLNLRCEYPPGQLLQSRPRTKRGGIITQYKKRPPTAPKLEPKPSKSYDTEYFLSRLPAYEQNIYPVFPIITPAELQDCIRKMNSVREDAALVYALFAVTVGHTKAGGDVADASSLIDLALDCKGVLKPNYVICIRSIITNVAISSCLVASNDIEIAWLYLREAVTMGSIIKLDEDEPAHNESSGGGNPEIILAERARRQRLYWMLYIHERFMAIHFYRPVLLSPLPRLPVRDPLIPKGVHDGFLQIIKLFRLVDGNFIKAYLGGSRVGATSSTATTEEEKHFLSSLPARETQPPVPADHAPAESSSDVNPSSGITKTWIEQKQNEIIGAEAEEDLESLTEMQKADLIVTQQWLKMLVWQMAMSRYWLSTGISEGCMSLLFPVQIAHKLRVIMSKFSDSSIEVHGSAILRKLFELSITIADVIILIPAKSLKESSDRIDDYMWIANFLLRQSSFTSLQKELLTEKLAKVNSIYPQSPTSRTESPGESSPGSEDPWLTLSRSFITTNNSPTNTSYLPESIPLVPDLNNLSEMSQGLLNEMNYQLQ